MHETVQQGLSQVGTGAVLATLLIFLGSYGLIISEKIHRTTVALFGGGLLVVLGSIMNFYSQEKAIATIDFNTIGLLVGMMIIVGIAKDTGIFQYVALKTAKLAKGDPWRIMLLFSLITAVFSAFLDNVTTVMLMVPMTLVICDNLNINPMPFLLTEIFMSNVGGAATLIGDPPNILIGSAAGLSFTQFLVNLGPPVIVMLLVLVFVIKILYKKRIQTDREHMEKIMSLNENESIEDIKLMKKSLFVLGLVIIGFFLHGMVHMEAATIAIFGAGLLLFLDNKNPERALGEVEWVTIFFFIGLFILVGGLESVGIIHWGATKLVDITHGNMQLTSFVLLWGGAIFSAFIDNIPFVATMIPVVQEMGNTFSDLNPLWWSLALGACLGGNGSLVGASANLVVAGIAEKSGYKIKFLDFLKTGFAIMIITVAISNVYIFFRYF
jgi:Na+/H+ antiporter NhaD/arsenite permease-like protein